MRQKGQALLLFMLILPFLLLLVLGGADLIEGLSVRHNLSYIAYETARCVDRDLEDPTHRYPCDPYLFASILAANLKLQNSRLINPQIVSVPCGPNCWQSTVTIQYAWQPIFAGFFPAISFNITQKD